MPLRLLLIEDSEDDALLLELELRNAGFDLVFARVDTPQELEAVLAENSWDAVIADYNLPAFTGLDALRIIQAKGLDLPFILVSGVIGEEKAVEAMKAGAHDYLMKGNFSRLAPALERELRDAATRREQRQAAAELSQHREHLEELVQQRTEDLTAANAELRTQSVKLCESEERLNLALRGANEGLWDWNVEHDTVYYSPRWKSMLGYTEDEVENNFNAWKRLVHPEDMEPALARVGDFLAGRTSKYENEFRMRHKDGHYLDILAKGVPLYDEQGKAVRMVGTHLDITEHKKLEEQLRQAQKMEAVGQLAGGVAHDFNNILSAILGYSEMSLIKLKENDPVKRNIEQILKAAERAAVLTKSLLAFSRKQAVTLALFDLGQVVKEFEVFLSRLIREDIELKVKRSEEPLAVMADRGQIEQVIMNLATNARDAMPNGGKLLVETRPVTLDEEFIVTHGYGKAGEYALLLVADSGFGMDKETQARIFEPFFTTKEQGKGTGLGLSMAYGIVKKHDGFIDVYSEPGTGTIFKIYLPRTEALAQDIKMAIREAAAPLQGGAETILVCEDDQELRNLAANVLSHFGYRVIEAVDGQDAIEKFVAHRESIDLVFIDAIMPKKNGRVARDEMKKECPDLKTIFVSGYSRDIFEENDTFDENTTFLHKPYSPNELGIKVREMLDKPLLPKGGA